jgi:hypothetical protein
LFVALTVRCRAVRSYRPALTQNLRNSVQATASDAIRGAVAGVASDLCQHREVSCSDNPFEIRPPDLLPFRRVHTALEIAALGANGADHIGVDDAHRSHCDVNGIEAGQVVQRSKGRLQ